MSNPVKWATKSEHIFGPNKWQQNYTLKQYWRHIFLFNSYRGDLSHGVKWPKREVDSSPPFSAEFENAWNLPPLPHTSFWLGISLSTGQLYFYTFACPRSFSEKELKLTGLYWSGKQAASSPSVASWLQITAVLFVTRWAVRTDRRMGGSSFTWRKHAVWFAHVMKIQIYRRRMRNPFHLFSLSLS